SLVAVMFAANDGFVEGVGATWNPIDSLRLMGSINDGMNGGTQGGAGATTPFANGGNDFNNDGTNIGLTGRAEFKVMGDWSEGSEFSMWSPDKTALILGAGMHWEQGETGDSQASATSGTFGPYDNYLTWTV